jgi:adhesin transport system membrane fusion protein
MTKQSPQGQVSGSPMTLLLLAVFCAFLLWAGLFEIDQTVRAQGQVISSARTQVIQAADGGVLAQILVKEGQRVATGERLATLEGTRSNASFDESRAKVAALATALVRAQAEAGGSHPDFRAHAEQFPQFVAAQRSLYEQRKRGVQEELATLQQALQMADAELRMNERLLASGDTSELEVMRTKRQRAEALGRMSAVRNKYRQEANLEAARLAEELASNQYKLEERQSVLEHTILNAPVAGIVKYLKVSTIGGVLRAGDELMHISPTDGDMVIEIKVNPTDIGQLKTGLPVAIRLDAYDYSIYGSLHGTLAYIGSDTLTEQGPTGAAASYYRAHVRLDAGRNRSNPKLADVPLRAGMTATVDIHTASRSVLHYLAKPVMKAFGGAMNER